MYWEAIGTLGEKIGFLAVVAFLVYVFLKVVVGLLVDLSIGSKSQAEEPGGVPVPDAAGLHVFSEYGDQYRFVDKNPTEETIRTTIRSLDWVGGFHEVILVASPGVSLEVSGSLDPADGLSSVYRDSKNKKYAVTREPPSTVENMEDLLVSFYSGDGRWKRMYVYE